MEFSEKCEVTVALLTQDVARHEHDLYDDHGKVPKIEARVDTSTQQLQHKLFVTAAAGAMGGAILANLGSGALVEIGKMLLKMVVG